MFRNKHRGVGRNLLVGLLVSLSILIAPLASTQTTYAQGGATPGATETGSGQESNDETVCAIEKMGWILCPLIETAGKVGDSMFQYLSKWFLETEPELLNTDESKGTKYAWNLALNIANLLFIAAFIAIIYSQVTGAGLSNYGIKRMLPRLILAAILVNVSYYICQGMVDLSNILGYEIKNFMLEAAKTISENSALPVQTGVEGTVDTATKNGTLGTIAMAALGVAGAVWMVLPLLFLGIGTVVISVLVIIVLLLIRKAFIIMLVVLSPIAFVAYLLPNTEKYFHKWLSMFWGLLMVFPVVGFLFGGGQLASAVLISAGMAGSVETLSSTGQQNEKCVKLPKMIPQSADEAKAEQSDCGEGVPLGLGLVAAGVAVAPLLAVAAVLKGALAAAGAMGSKISGAVNSATGAGVGKTIGKAEDGLKKRIGENTQARWQRFQARGISKEGGLASQLAGKQALRKARRADRLGLSKTSLEQAQRHALDKQLVDNAANNQSSSVLNGMTDLTRNRAIRGAQAGMDKLMNEDMQAASLSARNNTNGALIATIDNANADSERDVNDPVVAAAIHELAQRQDFRGLEKAINKFGSAGAGLVTRTLSSSISQNNPGFFTAGDLGSLSRGAMGGQTYMDIASKNIAARAFSPEKMAETGPGALKEASWIAGQKGGRTHEVLQDAANELLADDVLRGKLGRNRDTVGGLSIGTVTRDRPD